MVDLPFFKPLTPGGSDGGGTYEGADASVIITDAANGKTIGVQLSKVEGNILTIKDDGLFAAEVVSLNVDKLVQTDGEYMVLDGNY